VNSRVKAL